MLATRGLAGQMTSALYADGGVKVSGLALPGAVFVGGLLGMLAVRSVFVAVLWRRMMAHAAEAQTALSTKLFAHLMARPYADIVADETSRMLESIRIASRGLLQNLLRPFLAMCSDVIVAAGILVILVVLAPGATLLLAVWVALVYGLLSAVGRRFAATAGARRWAALHELRQLGGRAFDDLRNVRLSASEPALTERFRRQSARYAEAESVDIVLSLIPRYVTEATMVSAVCLLALWFAQSGRSEAEIARDLAVFAIAALRLQPAAQRMLGIGQQLVSRSPEINEIVADMRRPVLDLVPAGAAQGLPAFADRLRLDALTFAYEGSRAPLIDRVSLALERGDWVAVEGPSGCGKSTLIGLLVGLLEPASGHVVVDGARVDALHHFRGRSIGYVPQNVQLLDGTVADNLAFPEPADTLDAHEAERLLEALGLPVALDSPVGDSGMALSGGQRQRLALARALLRDPSLLILDEATSHLDTQAERTAYQVIADRLPGLTLIAVSHHGHPGPYWRRRWVRRESGWIDERTHDKCQ